MRKLVLVVLLLMFAAPALAHHKEDHDKGKPSHGCDQAKEPNHGNPYHSTCDGETETRGGHVDGSKGAADNKNPRGQQPNGSDDNNGYECDDNKGHPNPAHTGCRSPSPTPTPTPPPTLSPSPTPSDSVEPTPPITCKNPPCNPEPSPTPTIDICPDEMDDEDLVCAKRINRLPETGSGRALLTIGVLALILVVLGGAVVLLGKRWKR